MASNDLERDIFGGSDSDLSSEEDEEIQQREKPRRRLSPRAQADDESSDSGDEYVTERKAKSTKRRTKRRDDEEGEDGRERRRPKATKRKRKPVEEIDLSELPPEQASKIRLDRQIEEILRSKKSNRPKKRKKDAEEEALDRFADEEVSRLRESMLAAAADDDQANREKFPATAKLKMLPSVMEVLRKASLAQSIVDNNLLEGVRRWLEPLPDRSLPALNIQRDFFPILKKMEFIDGAVLKESGLGRVVLFYTKCKRVSPDIARTANDLVSAWSRPIIKRSASYRDRVVPYAQEGDGGDAMGASQVRAGFEGMKLNAIMARAKENEKNRVRKNAVMIPQRELGSYTVAPKMNVARGNISVDVDIERRRKNAERLRSLTRKVSMKG